MGRVSREYNHRKMVVLAQHPAFVVWSARFIGADMTSPVALYLPLWLHPKYEYKCERFMSEYLYVTTIETYTLLYLCKYRYRPDWLPFRLRPKIDPLVFQLNTTCLWGKVSSGTYLNETLVEVVQHRPYRKDRLSRAYFCCRQLANLRIVRIICLYNGLLGPVCYKLTESCFPCCGVQGFCRFWFKIQDFMGWN